MKKFVALLFTLACSFIFIPVEKVSAAIRAISEPLCPPGGFGSLCNLDVGHAGGIVGTIVQSLLLFAIILCLFFLVYGAIKYITSGGDKGKLDQARGTMFAALVGLLISLLAFSILNFILYFFTGQGISSMTIPKLVGH